MAADGRVRIEIEADSSDFRDEVGDLETEARGAADGLDELGDSAQDAGKDVGAVDVAVGTFIANGLTNLVAKLGETVGSLLELAESTREYREDMAKLDTAFTSAGHSTETASKTYEDFYAILGESDRTVEAVNHLAEFTKSEEELAKWSTIAAGVTAKFGDSLPIEGLTEAVNHTAKLGEVQGPLADSLEWVGISTDDFNKHLAMCNSEEERAALITRVLNREYAGAAEEYNELTASTQEARRATSEMEHAQAELGAAIEPVTTAWTKLKAQALQWLVDTGLPAAKEGWEWITNNIPTVATAVGGLTAAFVAFKIAQVAATAASQGMTLAQYAMAAAQGVLNAVMSANPIGLIIIAITALVAAFVYLWNNCEEFRNFWINLWENIKAAAGAVADWFKKAWEATLDWFKNAVAKIKDFFSEAWAGIKKVFSDSIIGAYFKAIWEHIKGIFAVVKAVLSGNWSDAWAAIKGIVNTWREFFAGVWEKIKGVFSVVGTWFKSKFEEAKDKIFDAFSDIKKKFTEIKEKIFGAFDNIKNDFKSVGRNILDGIWSGITAGWEWLKRQVSNVANSLLDAAKDALGIHSPSKEFAYIGKMVVDGLSSGIKTETPKATAAIKYMTSSVLGVMQKEVTKYEQLLKDENAKLTEIEREFATETVGIWNDLTSKVTQLQTDYANAYESRVQQIQSSLGLFSLVEKSAMVSAGDLTRALQSQVDLLVDYNQVLEDLAARGVDAELLEELRGMGIDATAELEALNNMSDTQLENYVNLWRQKTELAREAANQELAGLRADTLAEIETLNRGAAEQYIELCANYEAMGLQLAADMSDSMIAATASGLYAIEGQTESYTEAGADLMSGVVAGMAAKSDAVKNAATFAVRMAIAAAKAEAGIASPSKVMRDEIGKNLALGVGVGWEDNVDDVKRTMANDMGDITARVQASVAAENARAGQSMGRADTGFTDLARAVGIQTAGISSLSAQYRSGAANMRPVILQLNGRELGRAMLDVGGAEETRVGARLSLGGAY